MKVLLKRIYNCSTYCIGHIYVDGTYICDTIEDTDRGLDKSWPLSKIVKTKVGIAVFDFTKVINTHNARHHQENEDDFMRSVLANLISGG